MCLRAFYFKLVSHLNWARCFYTLTINMHMTTIHGFSSPKILPVYKKYNGRGYYVAISEADKDPEIDYIATIHHGIDLERFNFQSKPGDYLLFFGRIHHEKGTRECIDIAKRNGKYYWYFSERNL